MNKIVISKSIDIEDEVRKALSPYIRTYCRPLPMNYVLPNILVSQVGGVDSNTIDTFTVVIDARADTEADASDTLRTAVGLLKAIAKAQTTKLRHIVVNTSGSWGADPVRPDLAKCSATLLVTVHQEKTEV